MVWQRKDILDIETLTRVEIEFLLDRADRFLASDGPATKKFDTLNGKTVINLFFEDSTRTRTSFEIAAQRLSAAVVNISAKGSSVSKGETLLDTAQTLMAMRPDVIVCRHASAGAPQILARHLKAAIVNAGDGAHEHPTQALLDLKTVWLHKKRFDGLKVAIVGDIAHSRVARSNIYGFQKLGAHVVVVAPATLLPAGIADLGVEVFTDLKAGLEGADVVMLLRVQRERMALSPFPSLGEYASHYGLNARTSRYLKKDALILHPGPINRGVEIAPEIADGAQSLILQQVGVGVAVRMAVLEILANRDQKL